MPLISTLRRYAAIAARQSWKLAWRLAGLTLTISLAIALGFTLYAVSALPKLEPWHSERLDDEFNAILHSNLDFNGYLQQEEKLFAEMRATIAAWDTHNEAYQFSRFNPKSPANQLVDGAPYNRTFRLTPPKARGHALLMHGLTDSPYSMKAMAESLYKRGMAVTVLRLPGHGTLPSMLTEMHDRDWQAAVRIAARDIAARTPADQAFYIGGYSTGGTLALQYTLDALADSDLRRPDRVLLMSPAIELTRIANLASIIDFFSIVPIPVLEKVRWQEIVAEYDPYKFNSFPVNAARQVNRATKTLQRALIKATESGRIAQMPPVIAWQSVVDSTVGATGASDTLFAKLNGAEHRLILFDVNREQVLSSIQRPGARALIERITAAKRNYTLDVVSNSDPQSTRISIVRHAPDGNQTQRETTLDWPHSLVSLGHVALPFPPNDPAYGFQPGSGHRGIPSIGSWLLRGESGATTVSLGALTRLRSNPFWSLIDEDIGLIVAADASK
jgi:alpha-beta hydrolase superfamily lysophospholipase